MLSPDIQSQASSHYFLPSALFLDISYHSAPKLRSFQVLSFQQEFASKGNVPPAAPILEFWSQIFL